MQKILILLQEDLYFIFNVSIHFWQTSYSHISLTATQRPKCFFLQQGWHMHTKLSHLSGQRQWWLEDKLQELLPSVHPSLSASLLPTFNCPFSSCPHTFVITLSGGDRKSPGELCPEGQSTVTAFDFETSPQTWYTQILDCRHLKSLFLLMWLRRSSSDISQESVLPALDHRERKLLQGLSGSYCDCRANMQWTSIPQRIQLVVVLSSLYEGKRSVTIHVTQEFS